MELLLCVMMVVTIWSSPSSWMVPGGVYEGLPLRRRTPTRAYILGLGAQVALAVVSLPGWLYLIAALVFCQLLSWWKIWRIDVKSLKESSSERVDDLTVMLRPLIGASVEEAVAMALKKRAQENGNWVAVKATKLPFFGRAWDRGWSPQSTLIQSTRLYEVGTDGYIRPTDVLMNEKAD